KDAVAAQRHIFGAQVSLPLLELVQVAAVEGVVEHAWRICRADRLAQEQADDVAADADVDVWSHRVLAPAPGPATDDLRTEHVHVQDLGYHQMGHGEGYMVPASQAQGRARLRDRNRLLGRSDNRHRVNCHGCYLLSRLGATNPTTPSNGQGIDCRPMFQ